jgi:hypothetical protein
VAPAERLSALKHNYEAMKEMCLSEPATFDEVLTAPAKLVRRINETGCGKNMQFGNPAIGAIGESRKRRRFVIAGDNR